jgi:hypothetical protein
MYARMVRRSFDIGMSVRMSNNEIVKEMCAYRRVPFANHSVF